MTDRPDHDSRWEDSRWRAAVRSGMLRWYGSHQRDLPWRNAYSPYRTWISEIMLQQTQVSTVIPYFEAFIERFPDPTSLAKADQQEVLRYWEGLGYYRRARQLHNAAQVIVEKYGGEFPTVYDSVLSLPGIGRYTAGAILSISLGQRLPILEANTQRLYARLIGLEAPVTTGASQGLLWDVAAALLPRKDCGTFNQASMDLGSMICTPKSPSCHHCPLSARCVAFEKSLQEEIPGKIKKINYESVEEIAIVVQRRDGSVLVRECQTGERWAGLWDFPRFQRTESNKPPSLQAIEHMQNLYGQTIDHGTPLMQIKHGVTKYRITLQVLCCGSQGKAISTNSTRAWKSVKQLRTLPLSTTGRKIARQLQDRDLGS